MRALLFLGGLLAAVTPVHAQEPAASPARPRTILFVGNSFTFGAGSAAQGYNAASVTNENPGQGAIGGVPGIFKKFADEAHQPYEVHFETVGGKDLEYHYTHSLSVIAQAKWDVVVLQGFSTEALPPQRGGHRENFMKYARLLCEAIKGANPQAKIYLYETWPRADLIYPDKRPYHDAGQSGPMTNDLREGYEEARAGTKLDVKVIPVGERWQRAIVGGLAQANPYLPLEPGKLDLWAADHYHASVYGYYLAALTLFTDVAPFDVTTLGPDEQAAHDLGIPTEMAAKLQSVAAEGTARSAR